jgi:enoyl-CoA hydratase/carnithine racemase
MNHISYEREGRVAHIIFNRPEKLNAIALETTKELAEIWRTFRDDEEVWVGILSGRGRSFCVGADVGKLAIEEEAQWTIEKSLILGEHRMGPSNYRVWKPLIAALHGHVLGAGFYMAMECDIRIASEDAEFGLPEPKIGIPTLFAPYMRDFLPRGLSLEMLLLGEKISAKRAYEMGLVNRLVKTNEALSSAKEMAERLCEKGQLSLRAMKEVYRRSRDMDDHSALALIENLFTPVMNSKDASEGKRAFMEKRKPQWKCR